LVRKEPSNEIAYEIRWKSAVVTATDPAHFAGVGKLAAVSGTVFTHGTPSVTFSADQGTADKEKEVLTLEGNVKLTAVDGNSVVKGTTVLCDLMTYATADQIIKAEGRVSAVSSQFSMGPVPEAWCSNTLSQIASPSNFVPVRHNQPAPTHS